VRNAVVEEVVTVSDESVLRVHVRQIYLSVDPARVVADFGQRRTIIARRVSWSSDSRSIFAAVAEGDSDIVLMEGALPE